MKYSIFNRIIIYRYIYRMYNIMNIKTRFAPSPSGELHIGNVRTALYAWLFARNMGGKFLLRIENTNFKSDISDDYVVNIISVMKWLNLDWDEGPYFQTDRFDRYNHVIDNMINNQIAYKCYCSPERLKLLRINQMKNGEKPKYDGYCRLKSTNLCNNGVNNSAYVVRFCNPKTGQVSFHDKIHGVITFKNHELDDLIIRRANGVPTYNFCVVIDDMDMNITHVIRGEEHINNTPRQINILKSLNASVPIYAHVPMILDENRNKLSKRSKSLGIMQYRNEGFLPEAMLNYLVRLGWSYGNQEIFNIKQMQKYFNFKGISKSSSILNFKKLLWINRYYINNLPINYVAQHLLQYMNKNKIDYKNGPLLTDVIKLFASRCSTLKEIMHNCLFLYKNCNFFEKQVDQIDLTFNTLTSLKLLRSKLNNVDIWTVNSIKTIIQDTVIELNIDMIEIGTPLRIALTGIKHTPELSKIMYVLGKDRVLQRIDQSIFYIHKNLLNS